MSLVGRRPHPRPPWRSRSDSPRPSGCSLASIRRERRPASIPFRHSATSDLAVIDTRSRTMSLIRNVLAAGVALAAASPILAQQAKPITFDDAIAIALKQNIAVRQAQ